jgi:hypothetical protein
MIERPRRFDGDETDAAIDRAVREIMSRDPAPGFRQRVLARLQREPGVPWTWGRIGLIATASAVVLLLAMWTRTPQPQPLHQPVPEPRRAELERPVAPPAPTPTPKLLPTMPPSGVKREPRAVARRVRTSASDRRVAAASIDPAEERLERIDAARPPDARLEANPRPPGDPLNIPLLQIRPLETGEIRVKPMTVGPIVIVPLLPPR